MRMTKNKRLVLEALRPVSYEEAFESGQAPFNAAHIANRLGFDLSNVSRTLKNLEAQGLVIVERRKIEVWNEIIHGGRHDKREVTCYWHAHHYDEDRETVREYRQLREVRAEQSWNDFMARLR